MNRTEFENRVGQSMVVDCGVAAGVRVLVAVSGGADSVALLRVLLSLGYNCVAAHCNFHLRGEESMRDERFVRQLCALLNVPLRVRDFDVEACRREYGESVEMACRELRYQWFRELLDEDNCAVVAVAHHRDDNIETLFLNLLRGTGIAGLTGMRARNDRVVRPLLCVTRADVIEYLNGLGQDYVTDSTNLETDFQRNRVRNVLLHDLDECFVAARDRIADTMRNLADFELLYNELVTDVLSRSLIIAGDKVEFSLSRIKRFSRPKLLFHAMLSPYGFSMNQCEQIAAKLEEKPLDSKLHFYSLTNAVTLTNEKIVIEKIKSDINQEFLVDFSALSNLPVKLEVEKHELPFDRAGFDGKCRVAFDARLMNCKKLVLRHWRQGDRMRPYGMKGTRLLSDLFSDAHLTLQEKHRAWVLEADGEVLWVLGLRASAHYSVTADSTAYLCLSCPPLS